MGGECTSSLAQTVCPTAKLSQENEEEELSSLPKETLPTVGQHALLGWNMRTTRHFGGKTSLAEARPLPVLAMVGVARLQSLLRLVRERPQACIRVHHTRDAQSSSSSTVDTFCSPGRPSRASRTGIYFLLWFDAQLEPSQQHYDSSHLFAYLRRQRYDCVLCMTRLWCIIGKCRFPTRFRLQFGRF